MKQVEKHAPDYQLKSDYSPAGDQPAAIESLVKGFKAGLDCQTLLGVTGSGKTFVMAHVIKELKRPTLVMVHNKTLAAQLYGELKAFFPHNAVEYFVSYYDYYQPEAYVPSSDTFIEKDASINEHIEQMRLSATKALMQRRDVVIVSTVSCIYGLGDPELYFKMVLHLDRGDKIDQRFILHRLAEMQYSRNDADLKRATFRVRGDVIDIFPAESELEAIRLELFDDELEKITKIDPLTGEVLQQLPRVTIFPKSHYVTPRQTIIDAVECIKTELENRLTYYRANEKHLEAQRIEERTRFDIEMLLELGYCNGIENYSRYLSGRPSGDPPPTLFDYIPGDALFMIDESHVTVPQLGAMYKGDRSRKENLVNYGFRLPSALDNRPMRFEEWEQRRPQTLFVSATPGRYEKESKAPVAELVVRPTGLVDPLLDVRSVATQVDDLLSEIHKRAAKKERVLATVLTKRMAEDLTDYLQEKHVRVRYLHSDIDTVERIEIIRDLRLGAFDVLVGINLLREGLDIPEVSLVAILDADKEGFLRSETSLIQTIGRAARHLHGMAILYADKVTGSMQRAMDETKRRRNIQLAFNRLNGITPKGIVKPVVDIMEGAIVGKRRGRHALEYDAECSDALARSCYDPKSATKMIPILEKKMYDCAHNLEFEQAAKIRNDINRLKSLCLIGPFSSKK